jgi:hypothetical protein
MGMPPPIAFLIHIPEHLRALKDGFHVLNVLDSKVLTIAIEMDTGIKHQLSSVTDSVAVLAVTPATF